MPTVTQKRTALVNAIEITKAYASSSPDNESYVVDCLAKTYEKLVELIAATETPDESD